MAPPNTYANIAVNSNGCKVTSKNCSGLRRIFFNARHAMESVWLTVSATLLRGRARTTAATGSMRGVALGTAPAGGLASTVIVLISRPPGQLHLGQPRHGLAPRAHPCHAR